MASRERFIFGAPAGGAGASLWIRVVVFFRPPAPLLRINAAALWEGPFEAIPDAAIT